MATTSYNISRILDRVTNYSREEVRDTLDEVQRIVYSVEAEQCFYIDATTGMPPILTTTDGQYQYNCPSNCRRTAVIFTESWPYPYSRTRPQFPWKRYYFRGKGYYKVPVHSRDALPDNDQVGTVTFYVNPGDTTDKYYHLYWLNPTRISDETIELSIPPHVHWRVREVCIQLLSKEQHGETGMQEALIEKQIKKIRSELNAGAKILAGETPIRAVDQHYPEVWIGRL